MKPLAENVHLTPLGDALEIVDQTLLPTEKRLITLKTRGGALSRHLYIAGARCSCHRDFCWVCPVCSGASDILIFSCSIYPVSDRTGC